jgi:hypothetical protein
MDDISRAESLCDKRLVFLLSRTEQQIKIPMQQIPSYTKSVFHSWSKICQGLLHILVVSDSSSRWSIAGRKLFRDRCAQRTPKFASSSQINECIQQQLSKSDASLQKPEFRLKFALHLRISFKICTDEQTDPDKQTDTRENWRSNSTMNPLRFHQSTNRRKKKLFQEQTGSRTKPWRGYYGYDGCAGWECCDWIRWQSNTRQSNRRRTPRRSSSTHTRAAFDRRRTRRASFSTHTMVLGNSATVLGNSGPRELRPVGFSTHTKVLGNSATVLENSAPRELGAVGFSTHTHPGPQKLRNRPRKLRSSRTPPGSVLTGLVAHR